MTGDEVYCKLVAALEAHGGAQDDHELQALIAAERVQPLALASIAFELRELRASLEPHEITVPR